MNNLIIYGIGATGKYVVDCLEKKTKLQLIVDQFTKLKSYKGIAIKKIDYLKKIKSNFSVLLALHNHYTDISSVYKKLSKYKCNKIYSLIDFPDINLIYNLKKKESKNNQFNWHWFSPKFKYYKYKKQIKNIRQLFLDIKSKIILDKVVKYRDYGKISDYPFPSLNDEYIPSDLPKYKNAINYIDCGADKGQTIKNISKLGVKLNSVLAFEPDKKNFKKLLLTKKKNYQFYRTGVFNKKCILKFNSTGAMSSRIILEKSKNVINSKINCDKLDNYCTNFIPHLIKYDVEGAEIEALKGSKETIIKHLPNLAVSLYHKPEHLFKIPLLIKSWNLNYRFYLRLHEYNTYGLVLYCYNMNLFK
jgi:FkbM family methyltransferase